MNSILLGRSGYGKTTYITNKIKEDLANGYDNIIVIVPDQFTFETERELIRETKRGLFEIRVLSFRRLISLLRDELGTNGCFELDEVSKAMFVSKLLYDYNNELQIYKDAYKTPSFSFDMAKVVTECKQFGVAPEDLSSVPESTRTGTKLKDISTIYSAYNSFKEEFKDNEDIINLITGRIHSSRLLRGARVYIDHFDVFTFQGYNMIEEMAKIASSMTICLCGDGNEKGLFSLTTETLKRLKERVPDIEVIEFNTSNSKGAISHLERHLFDGSDEAIANTDNSVELFSFSNGLSEIDHAAAKIVELTRKGYHYCDISLMVGDIEEYGKAIEQCLKDCGIPTFMDKKTPLTSSRIAKFIIYSLRYCVSMQQSDFISMLKQGIIIFDDEDIRSFENYILKFGLKKALSSDKIQENDIKKISKQFKKYKLPHSLSSVKTAKAMAEVIKEYLYSFKIPFASELEERSFNKIIDILDNTILIFENTEIDLSLFVTLLETGMSSVTLGDIPDKKDCVVIGDISRTKIQQAKCLLVLGISDGIIPKLTQKTGVLSDYDAKVIKDKGNNIKIGRDSIDLNNLERLLTYKMFSKPTDYLYLSHSDRGIYGDERTNRMLFPKIQRLLGDIQINSDVPFNESISKRMLNNRQLALKKLYSDISVSEDNYITAGLRHYFKDEIDNLLKPRSYDMKITQEEVDAVYKDTVMSASRIETYFKCAFMQFIKFGIRPKPRQIYKINKLDTGSLLHSIIEAFSKDIIDRTSKCSKDKEKLDKIYNELKEEIIGNNKNGSNKIENIIKAQLENDDISIYDKDKIGKVMLNRITKICQSALLGVLDDLKSSGFVLSSTEQDLSSLTNKYTIGDMEIKGRIDRVDTSEDGIRIVDYKQGGSELDYTSIYAGVKLQLFIYMCAILNEYKKEHKKNMAPKALEYYKVNTDYQKVESADKLDKISDGDNKQRVSSISVDDEKRTSISQQDMERLVYFGEEKATEATEGIYSGDISISPYYIYGQQGACGCTYCDYMDICQNSNMENARIFSKKTLQDIASKDNSEESNEQSNME